MNEVIAQIRRWQAENQTVALATVVQTWGSAPRKAGAKLAITADGRMAGSVSGGCVEGAVAEEAFAALESGSARLLTFGVADETAWEVGLACGGTIRVFVEPLERQIFPKVDGLLAAKESAAIATVVAGPQTLMGRKLLLDSRGARTGSIDAAIDANLAAIMETARRSGASQRLELESPEAESPGTESPGTESPKVEIFIDVLLPPPALIIVGAVHIGGALTSLARTLGYRTVVIDPRQAFASAERFPHADQLIATWPQDAFPTLTLTENTAVALLTHDPKIDDPALEFVLNSPVFYIGALGSRKTHASRLARLQSAGFDAEQIARIHGPIGLDINAQNAEEIALSIMAEIVAVRRGG